MAVNNAFFVLRVSNLRIQIDIILGVHLWANPGNGAIGMISDIITAHYLFFYMLFMQLWGNLGHGIIWVPNLDIC